MCGFEALNSNVDGKYLEAIVRGYKLGLRTCVDYNNLFLVRECGRHQHAFESHQLWHALGN